MNAFLITNICAVTPEKTLEKAVIWVEDGRIKQVCEKSELPSTANALPKIDGKNTFALPGFIDLHIHGFAGFGVETGNAQDLLAMSAELGKHGVTAFTPTLYCGQPEDMARLLRLLSPALGKETGAKILGFHLEGPFISPAKPGVMKPQDIAPANLEVLKNLYEASNGKIVSMTLAPELPNIEPIIEFCRSHGILLQAGHTNATYEEFALGAARGVTHATHLFNAMSPFTQRAPGASGAVLMNPGISCEIIADGVHVHPDIVGFLRTVKPVENIILVTDALRPTGQEKGPFLANGEEVVLSGGVWKRKADNVIAGSALTMARGVKNLVDFGYTLPQAALCAASNPARLLGLAHTGKLEPGSVADLVLLNADFKPVKTFIQGKEI